jgi:hypothetical protein
MRFFNTSGPNIPAEHYTLRREELTQQGMDLVRGSYYYTIWAPRQTGKSTFFRLMADLLKEDGFQVVQFNLENYKNASFKSFMGTIRTELDKIGIHLPIFETFDEFSNFLAQINDRRLVLIIDEIEGLNPAYFGQFLHTIRNLYHSRDTHCLKSVILVGVSNIIGIVKDNASPFNIAFNLLIPYFNETEVNELLNQHVTESGQQFEQKVIDKIFEITAGQPGLVNGFAYQLVKNNPQKQVLTYDDYLKVEDWYLTEAIDKNVSNILNKAEDFRPVLEKMLFTEIEIPFLINRSEIKALYANGIIKKSETGKAEFWVPLYKKALFDAFYPYINGEKDHVSSTLDTLTFFNEADELDIPKLIAHYKAYAARRGFKPFIKKKKNGEISLREAGLIYSFETFLAAFVIEAEGKTYREADTGLGKSDLIIHLRGREYLFETKKYYSPAKFTKGKGQLAHYARSLGLDKAVYVVFVPNNIEYPAYVNEGVEMHDGLEIVVYLVPYDEVKDF